MSPPLLNSVEALGNVPVVAASPSMDCLSQNGTKFRERNYLRLSPCSSVDSSAVSNLSEENKSNLNLKATELRLGLPGSLSPERDQEFTLMSSGEPDEKTLLQLLPSKDGFSVASQKNIVSGSKRGFSDTMEGYSEVKGPLYTERNWMFHAASPDLESPYPVGQGKFHANSGVNAMLSSRRPSGPQPNATKELPSKGLQEWPCETKGSDHGNKGASNDHNNAPASKAQVVGWPPIKSFRKNSLVTNSKNNDEVDGKPGSSALFVKVSMEGAPYLRKVDLRNYSTYQELSSALEKMFSCFTLGQYGSHGAPGRDKLSESKLRDHLHGSEYVLTYEDRDGDWMLVGEIPWEMFIDSCKRLKIVKGSDAIGLAPRATERSKNRI